MEWILFCLAPGGDASADRLSEYRFQSESAAEEIRHWLDEQGRGIKMTIIKDWPSRDKPSWMRKAAI